MNNLSSLQYFIPELVIILSILSVIVFDLIPKLKKWIYVIAVGSLIAVSVLLFFTSGQQQTIFMGLLAVDPFSHIFKGIFVISTLVIIIISNHSVEINKKLNSEYLSLVMIVLLGLFLMATSVNLLMIYLSIELVSIPSYILAGINKNDRASNEASLKYVIFGSFASGVMLFGLSWLYGISGSTNIIDVGNMLLLNGNPLLVYMSLIFILVGFGYKISMAPFHYWTPDVYEGAPTPITAFFSIAPKAAGFAILIRIFYSIFTENSTLATSEPLQYINWSFVIAILSALTMTIGNFLALHQQNLRRILAYSSIAHVGFMLMAFSVISPESIEAIVLYLIIYMFMNLSAFFVVIFAKNKLDAENIDDLNGLSVKNPLIAAFMVISMVSLAGLPPTAGFIGKFYLFATLFRSGQFYWLAIIAILNSVVSLYYYFRIVKSMYFDDVVNDVKTVNPHPIVKWSIILFSSQALLFYFYWTPLVNFIHRSMHFWNS